MNYGFVNKPCFFCGGKETLLFNEHYHFCPECSAIYTNMIVQKGCKHIHGDAIVALREPWFDGFRQTLRHDGKFYLINEMFCSFCGTVCVADGW